MSGSSSLSLLKEKDPVTVESKDGSMLEGVVAYLGTVDFSSDNDWVGVQLTGSSVGKGKNDGSVQGKKYFTTAPGNGMFCRKANVTKRTLSRLEELRLKRELAGKSKSSLSSTSSSRGITSPKPRSSFRSSILDTTKSPQPSQTNNTNTTLPEVTSVTTTDDSSVASSITTSASSTRTRLDEIRERRLALAAGNKKKKQSLSPKKTTTTTTTPVASNTTTFMDDANTTAQIQALEEKLRQSQEECQTLKQQLEQTKEQLHTVTNASSDQKEQEDEALVRVKEELNEARKTIKDNQEQYQNEKSMLESQLSQNVDALQHELDKEREVHLEEKKDLQKNLDSTKKELSKYQQQSLQKKTSESVHYKERAKLQAEVTALNRKIQQYEDDKILHDTSMEELVLDKEAIQEEFEMAQDKLEELRIDVESAQIEIEELRDELEKAREANNINSLSVEGGNTNNEEEDVMQALSQQNARLREAILRLREQSSMEKLNLTQQLRSVEKEAQTANSKLQSLTVEKSNSDDLKRQVAELMEMVDQAGAMESMVEQLSDRVMGLEDDIAEHMSIIRELEEASEIAAEMEEAQSDEIKALMKDVEDRDTLIRNLQEAIQIQRTREEDFAKTVSNYRQTVAKLKQQCQALLSLQENSSSESNRAMAASQKALAKAAQYVADSIQFQKKEARSTQYHIEASTRQHTVQRMETLIPSIFPEINTELHAIKGELLLHQVAIKASLSLESVSSIFTESIQKSLAFIKEKSEEKDDGLTDGQVSLELSEEQVQNYGIMTHQLKFVELVIEAGSDALRWMAAGQWPDLLSTQASCELASAATVHYTSIDSALGEQLQILKEEGGLSPKHRSNLALLTQSLDSHKQVGDSIAEILPNDWNPPGWEFIKDLCIAKFTCLAAASIVACAVHAEDDSAFIYSGDKGKKIQQSQRAKSSILKTLLNKLESLCTEAVRITDQNYYVETENEELSSLASSWKGISANLLSYCKALFYEGEDSSVISLTKTDTKYKLCESQADATLRLTSKIASTLRIVTSGVTSNSQMKHALSPETNDPWRGISGLVRKVRLINGDEDDLNYLIRARDIEQRLGEAIENDAKLSIANNKINSLEKVRKVSVRCLLLLLLLLFISTV